MPTTIKAGVYNPPFMADGEDGEMANIYIDSDYMQVYDSDDKFVFQLTFAEINAVLSIMSSEQERVVSLLKGLIRKN
jgi:hypothetical protein